MLHMVFDVESIGLHGEGYAVGWVVVDDKTGQEEDVGLLACSPDMAVGLAGDRKWVETNCPKIPVRFDNPGQVRVQFSEVWNFWRERTVRLWADCGWPVEANFLTLCVGDGIINSPYPLHEIATARMLAGFDPIATYDRRPVELPVHNPQMDARQSGRLLLEALEKLNGKSPQLDDASIRTVHHMTKCGFAQAKQALTANEWSVDRAIKWIIANR
jgi:hypothetical protein